MRLPVCNAAACEWSFFTQFLYTQQRCSALLVNLPPFTGVVAVTGVASSKYLIGNGPATLQQEKHAIIRKSSGCPD